MTEGTAIELAKQKMKESGEENYILRFRHFQLPPISKVELNAYNELLILIRPEPYVKMYSKTGIYNSQDTKINEMQYLHQGATIIINQDYKNHLQVKVLQVIPKNTTQDGRDNR
jgi:hypothetical protein